MVATRPKLSDVAARARVSVMTVSNVVNGRFDMMSATTRRRVEDAIRALNYRPSAAGRSLRLDERLNIGMLIVDESPSFLTDPFTAHLVAGLSNFLSVRGYGLVLQGARPGELCKAIFMKRFTTDGLCVLLSGHPSGYGEQIRMLASLGQPLIAFELQDGARHKNVCCVRQDDFGGARKLARHLLACGARRFLMLLPELEWPAIAERRRGVEAALRGARGVELRVAFSGESFEQTQEALRGALASGWMPDAVLGGNDQMGIAAMRLLKSRGLRVPDDVMVSGFNAFEFRPYADPVLTSVVSPAHAMGARAGEELLRVLTAGDFSGVDIVLPTELVIGGSTRGA